MIGAATPVEEVIDDRAKSLNPSPIDDSTRHANQTSLFAFTNTEAIKEKVRKAKNPKNQYDVRDMYWDYGFAQKIARHWFFENFTLGVIVVNAIWIGVDTNYNKAETINKADTVFILADCLFFTYFSMELIIRFLAFKRKINCFKDAWFVFDSILVALYVFDPFVLGIISALQSGEESLSLPTEILRLFRLARLSRLVRMLRSLPELMILIKGMVSAMGTVVYALLLQVLITYIFSIMLVNLFEKDSDFRKSRFHGDENPLGFFYTVPDGMHSLVVFATFLDDLSAFIYPVKDESYFALFVCFVYIMLASMVVMNMLIAVLCAVIDAVALEEKESMIIDKVHEKFGDIVKMLDTNNDKMLCWDEFGKILDCPEALNALESVNVDPEALIDAAEDFFWEDGKGVSIKFDDFMSMILDMRGGQPATVKDIMSVQKRFTKKFLKVQGRMDNLEEKCNKILEKLGVDTRAIDGGPRQQNSGTHFEPEADAGVRGKPGFSP